MVMAHMDPDRYLAYLVHIERDGWWAENRDGGERIPVDKDTLGYTSPGGQAIKADLAFVMVHGTPGEDGLLKRTSTCAAFPTPPPMLGSWPPPFTKDGPRRCCATQAFPSLNRSNAPPTKLGTRTAWTRSWRNWDCPVFVKPNESGSSIGISRVAERDELWPAIEGARETGTSTVLIEALLLGREFTCGVIPDGHGGVQALPVTEIISNNAFFDYAAKYDGESREVTPAELTQRDTLALQKRPWTCTMPFISKAWPAWT